MANAILPDQARLSRPSASGTYFRLDAVSPILFAVRRRTSVADTPRDAFGVRALILCVRYRLDELPEHVPEQADADHDEQEYTERLRPQSLDRTACAGRLAAHLESLSQRQNTYNRVHETFRRVT